MYITLAYFRMIAWLMAFFEAKTCILVYKEIISETSNPKEDYNHIVQPEIYESCAACDMMTEVGKLRTKTEQCILIALISTASLSTRTCSGVNKL